MYVTIIVIIIIIYVHYCCYMIYTVERERGALNFSKTTSPSAPGLAIWQPESRLLSLLFRSLAGGKRSRVIGSGHMLHVESSYHYIYYIFD